MKRWLNLLISVFVGADSFKNLKSRSKLKKNKDDNGTDSEDTEKAGTKGTFKDEGKSPTKSPTKNNKPPARKKKTAVTGEG